MMKDHINRYAERSLNCDSRMINLYREIYKIWFHYFGQIYYNCPFDSEKIKQLHRDGRFLLSETGDGQIACRGRCTDPGMLAMSCAMAIPPAGVPFL